MAVTEKANWLECFKEWEIRKCLGEACTENLCKNFRYKGDHKGAE